MEYFAFQRYDWSNKPRKAGDSSPNIIANKHLLENLWNKSLRGGLESMEGFVADINTWFNTQPIEPNESFEWQGWKVILVQQIHVMSGSIIMPSFGIMFSKNEHKTIYFVTDSQHCSPRQMEDFYTWADIIFQDSEFVGIDTTFEEGALYFEKEGEKILKSQMNDMDILVKMAEQWEEKTWSRYNFDSGVHANYGQLAGYPSANCIKLDPKIKRKMWLSHYQDYVPKGRDMYVGKINWEDQIKKDGFAGLIKVGQIFKM